MAFIFSEDELKVITAFRDRDASLNPNDVGNFDQRGRSKLIFRRERIKEVGVN